MNSKHTYVELKDKVIVPGWPTLMLEIDFVGGTSHNQFINIPFLSVKEPLQLPREKKLVDYLTIDVEPSGHSTVNVYFQIHDFLVLTLNSISVYKDPLKPFMFIRLSEQQSKHAINAAFNVFSFRLRNIGVGPLGPDIRHSGP
ncbi:matrix protein [Parrot bornavirus 4]|uniref:M n=19 Tax=Parrot bornavirus 4 TaxID=1548718 RepID=F6JSK4_9MONO|nr:matrix protein [Parrot bornavirus 4]ACJ71391.1 M [Parrot bornavirus 4] [Parrot bornavirus 4]AEG41942.1 matrix protein [Parrot bornavirus 4]AER30496.1 matrix protein [Parrot bornavirus 4]AEW69857.1 matrix protein [Parrot bornavirus 4]AEW69869.1 matrix protein [Parrot bornavirus 4]